MEEAAIGALGQLIRDRSWNGILVAAEDGRDPDTCRFSNGRRLGLTVVWVDASGAATLVYFADMERDEAAATGLSVLGPRELELTLLRRETRSTGELLARTALRLWRTLGVQSGEIGLAGRLHVGDAADLARMLTDRGWGVSSAAGALRSWRRCKTDREQELARATAAITCEAFVLIAERLRQATTASTTAGDLRRLVAAHFADNGLEQPRGNIVACGGASAVPHSTGPDDDVILPGQTVVVDLFPRGLLFADCSRTFCLPPIPPHVERAHGTVLAALGAACKVAFDGTRVSWLVGDALTKIEDAGYPTLRSDRTTRSGMVHSLGHGVGYELHEAPGLRGGTEGTLELGDLITIEPGLYDPEAGWGIRLEDMLLIEESGPSNLTTLPYDLDPAAWVSPGDPNGLQ